MYKLSLLLLAFIFPLAAVSSDDGAPEGFIYWSASSLKDLGKTLQQKASADPHKAATQPEGDFPNELYLFAHRDADGVPEWHETQTDIIFVESGKATLLVGGTLNGAETTAPHEKRNGTIVGGVRRNLGPGDVVRIPAKMPHQLLVENNGDFNYFVAKVKGY